MYSTIEMGLYLEPDLKPIDSQTQNLVVALLDLVREANILGHDDVVEFGRAKLQMMVDSAPFNTKLGLREYGRIEYHPNGLVRLKAAGANNPGVVLKPYEIPAPIDAPVYKKPVPCYERTYEHVESSPPTYDLFDIFGLHDAHLFYQYHAINKRRMPRFLVHRMYQVDEKIVPVDVALKFLGACEADRWKNLGENPVHNMVVSLIFQLRELFCEYPREADMAPHRAIFTMTDAAFAHMKKHMVKGRIGNLSHQYHMLTSEFKSRLFNLCTSETLILPHGDIRLHREGTRNCGAYRAQPLNATQGCVVREAYETIEATTGPLRAALNHIGLTSPQVTKQSE